MYATLSYDVNAGPERIEDVRRAILDLFKDRLTCDLLSDTFICGIVNTADYLAMVKKLRRIGTDFQDQFEFVFTLHRTGDPLRSNAAYPKAKARKIIDMLLAASAGAQDTSFTAPSGSRPIVDPDGLFLRFYRGQDYYNLGFAEAISRLQVGFTLQQDTFLSFRIRPQ